MRERCYYTSKGGMNMDISKKIKAACAYAGKSEAQVAREIGTSPSAFNQRLKTGKFSSEELEKIAAALGASLVCYFQFEDGGHI